MNALNSLFGVSLLILGSIVGYFLRQTIVSKRTKSLEQVIKKQLEESKAKVADIVLKAQEKAADLLEKSTIEEKERKTQLLKLEERLLRREEILDQESAGLKTKDQQNQQTAKELEETKVEISSLRNEAIIQLEKVSGFSKDEAREVLLKDVREQYQKELSQSLEKLEKDKKEVLEKKSLEIMTTAIQRLSRSHVANVTTTNFDLKSEDLKGKIIGREGRNIRTLERLTGVELIIDETPDSLVISSFDPVRREIARLTLEKLIADGRIQPAKIEEKVEEAKQEINKRTIEEGEKAASELGIYNLPKELVQLLGRLYFRFSFGQNVLLHSIETAHLSSMIASELGIKVEVAKKAGLLHDIGKSIDYEVEGSHVELGRKILKKYGIEEDVIKAMESHHEDYPFATSESFVVAAADAISAARPGARRDSLENYIKRLEELEKVAVAFKGVKNAYAISAGRELRVFIEPEKVDDFGALQLAREIALKIESELKYPGEIKVTVIRETRAVEYAK
ncbi:MAG: ribonuclease Y [Candidatus Paceibacterota bacterium]|jgi:ribonuclease Y